MSALVTLSSKLATALNMGADGAELIQVLKSTAFRGQVSDAQMTALLIVAQQHGLNPWTKEIYAFPDQRNGIVPVVGVDGWARIINTHPQFDGMDFEQDAESCTCAIYRKDRSRPIRVTEWMAECRRPNVGPWQSHPRRMLRHKAIIQCARLAFGFGGIYDEDEAQRIVDSAPEAKPAATDLMPKAKPAAAIQHEPQPAAEAIEGEVVDGEQAQGSGLSELTEGQRKVLLANAARAGLNEAELLQRFPSITPANITDTLRALRQIAERTEA